MIFLTIEERGEAACRVMAKRLIRKISAGAADADELQLLPAALKLSGWVGMGEGDSLIDTPAPRPKRQ